MNNFAKLITENRGQILAVFHEELEDESGSTPPTIVITVKPENMGTCDYKLRFADSDEGFDKAQEAFENMDEEQMLKIGKDLYDECEKFSKEVLSE